jgi:hypothetical protein
MPLVRWTLADLERYRQRTGLGAVATRSPERIPEPARALEPDNRLVPLLADPGGTLTVRLVRVGGRRMDVDNLAGGFKPLRDAIAAAFGRQSDSEASGWRWEYDQEPGESGTRIEISQQKTTRKEC